MVLPITNANVGKPRDVFRMTASLKKTEAESVSEAFKSLMLGSAELVR